MSETKRFEISAIPTELAHSDAHQAVTIINNSSHAIAIVIDERNQSQRVTEGDGDASYIIPQKSERLFSGFKGRVEAKLIDGSNQIINITVVRT